MENFGIARPKILKVLASRPKDFHTFKSYIPKMIIRAVEADEPVQYLTEIRQVVIVFVNVIMKSLDHSSLIKIVDQSYQLVCK